MVEIMFGPIVTVVLLAIILFLALKFGKFIGYIVVNSIVGLISFVLLNFTGVFSIPFNIWSLLIVALGGIPGVLIVAALDFFGLLF